MGINAVHFIIINPSIMIDPVLNLPAVFILVGIRIKQLELIVFLDLKNGRGMNHHEVDIPASGSGLGISTSGSRGSGVQGDPFIETGLWDHDHIHIVVILYCG